MNKINKIMIRKGLTMLGIIILVCLCIYFVTDYFNKTYVRRDSVNPQNQFASNTKPAVRPGTIEPPKTLSPEKQEILNAALNNIKEVMASKDAKKIRALMTSMYPDKTSIDSLSKMSDVNLLKSAQMFVDYNVAKTFSYILPSLPDSAWTISGDKATIVQDQGNRKVYFYATKIDGVWK